MVSSGAVWLTRQAGLKDGCAQDDTAPLIAKLHDDSALRSPTKSDVIGSCDGCRSTSHLDSHALD
jgi:hypothetical protein